nr:hypothetical protein [Pseudorhodoferax sp. Leaf267]
MRRRPASLPVPRARSMPVGAARR